MDEPSAPRRIGLRDIAQAAGVCLMTASLSLRDSPKISAPTRKRVREIAARMGYRPDPEISRLMGRLRASRQIRGGVVLALVDLRRGGSSIEHPYHVSIRESATQQAEALGFGVTVFRLAAYDGSLARLIRVVRSRGITGLVLLPPDEPMTLDPAIDWDGLSVVSATTGVASPRFHQVVPNQLHNMMTLIERLHALGYRRIGAVLKEVLEQRTRHYYSIALNWHGHGRRILVLPDGTPPAEARRRIATWLQRHQPDAVLAQDADAVSLVIQERTGTHPDRPRLVSLSGRTDDRMPYQDQLPDLIGASAVSLLTGMMHNHETGVPLHPRVTTVDGVIREPEAKAVRADE